MPKSRGRKRPGGRGTRPPSRPPEPVEGQAEDQDLFQGIGSALRSNEPIDLLALVSGLLEVTDPRRTDPFATEEDDERPSLPDLVESFLGTQAVETSAVLAAIAALTPDELLATRIKRELGRRRDPLPAWLEALPRSTVEGEVWHLGDPLGDADNYVFGVGLPTGQALTVLFSIDHNLGGLVNDAFLAPEPVAGLVTAMREQAVTDPDLSVVSVDPALARAAVEQAIEHGSLAYPPPESETWPMCRPLAEWMLRLLPAGGTAPARPVWTEKQLAALKNDFFASPYGSDLDDQDRRGLLESLLWYGTDYGPGDPLRWSETKVEILLLDWFPRKVLADREYLAQLPDLLLAFIAYAHERSGVRAELTQEVLAATRHFTPTYLEQLRPSGDSPADQLAALLEGYGVEPDGDLFQGLLGQLGLTDEFESLDQQMAHYLDLTVGGRDRLLALTADPLPDEPFAWDGIDDDIRAVVAETLEHGDRCADQLLDVEHRTAMRRFLARAAVNDPAIFRRKSSPIRGAAAVAWVICRANDTAGSYRGTLSVTELMAFFGVKGSVSQRAEPLLKANGADARGFSYQPDLGTPDLLVSSTRAELIDRRDRIFGD